MNILKMFSNKKSIDIKKEKDTFITLKEPLDLIRYENQYHNKYIKLYCKVIDIYDNDYSLCPATLSPRYFKDLKVIILCQCDNQNFILEDELDIIIKDFKVIKLDNSYYELILYAKSVEIHNEDDDDYMYW